MGSLSIFRQLQGCCQFDVAAGVTHLEEILTSLRDPLRASLIERRQVAFLQCHRQRLALARLQLSGLGKALQLLSRLLQLTLGGSDVELCHFLTSHLTRILHGDGNLYAVTFHL